MPENGPKIGNNNNVSALQLWLAFVLGLVCMVLAVVVFDRRSRTVSESGSQEREGQLSSLEASKSAFLGAAQTLRSESIISQDRDRWGLTVSPLTAEMADRYTIPREQKGVVVAALSAGSRAQRAGLKEGDLIRGVSRKKTGDMSLFLAAISRNSSEPLVLDVSRQGRDVFLFVEPGPTGGNYPLPASQETTDGKSPGMKRPMTVPSTDGVGKTPPTNRPTIVPGYDNSGRTAVPGFDSGGIIL